MKISIITPTWNQAKFIERTILSIINQKGNFDLEYIVMDGGSTDGTVDILKKYETIIRENRKYKHIKFVWKSEKDKGQSDAINKGLKMATGDVVAFINSDDTYSDGAFDKVIKLFEENPKGVWVFGKCRIVNENDVEIRKPITWYKNILLKFHSVPLLLSENYISQPATFWRREILEKVGYFNEEEHLVMDYDYWLRIVTEYGDGDFVDNYLANFRMYDTSKSGSGFIKQFDDELRVAKKYGTGHLFALAFHEFNRVKIVGIYSMMNFLKSLRK